MNVLVWSYSLPITWFITESSDFRLIENGSQSKNPDIKTPLLAKNKWQIPAKKLNTSGVLTSGFFERLSYVTTPIKSIYFRGPTNDWKNWTVSYHIPGKSNIEYIKFADKACQEVISFKLEIQPELFLMRSNKINEHAS